jgi:hypothetical protein
MKLKLNDPVRNNRSRDLFVQADHGTICTTSTKKNASAAASIAELFALDQTPVARNRTRTFSAVRGPNFH